MYKHKKATRNIVIYLICLCLMIACVMGIVWQSNHDQQVTGQTKAEEGMLDLNQAKFYEPGYVYLNEE